MPGSTQDDDHQRTEIENQPMSLNAISLVLIILPLFYLTLKRFISSVDDGHPRKKLPGPPGLPIIGNLLQIPKERPWVQMAKWTKQYGLSCITTLVIGSPKIANELLDKRSAKYSSRPRHIMTSEHVSRGLRMTFMPYGELWKNERRLVHLLTQPKAAQSYEPIQSQESLQLCLDLINQPDQHWKHCQRYAGSTVLQVVFNRRALNNTDRSIKQMKELNEKMTQTVAPGRYWVEYLTILNCLPESICNWKLEANQIFNETFELFSKLYDLTLSNVNRNRVCFVEMIEKNKLEFKLNRQQAVFLAGSMFGAGSDTTAAAIETFMFACAVHPEKMIKAQEEIDKVIGRNRLPQFEDQDSLIYCQAMIRELLRWRTVIPGGLAHMTTEDDIYDGYFIAKGTSVVANHWSLHLDEEVYEKPETFNPERFINSLNGNLKGTKFSERGHHAYGFGRRICPGQYIAERSLFITCTRILWSCTIQANESIDLNRFSSGFSSYPLNLLIKILPRDESVEKTLNEEIEYIGLDPI